MPVTLVVLDSQTLQGLESNSEASGVSGPTSGPQAGAGSVRGGSHGGLEGTVVLAIEIRRDGLAHNIQMFSSLGLGSDEKAVEAVRKRRFRLGTKDGKRVRV